MFWEDKGKNLSKLNQMLGNLGETDVLILPEMFHTGFSMRAAELAEEPEGETLEWMQNLARARSTAVCASYIVKDEGRYFNRLYWVNPDGTYLNYDKRHLFSLAGEEQVFTPGKKRLVVNFRGWRIQPLICYDLRFPVWCANEAPYYDLLLFAANWPDRRITHWDQLLIARAIENQAYVVGVNRVGADGNGIAHSGHSALVAPDGELITRIEGRETIFQAVLQKDRIDKFRSYLSALDDSDSFKIID